MVTRSPESVEEQVGRLRHAVELLESEDDVNRNLLIGVDAPATESVLSNQNLAAYEYYQVPLNPDVYQSVHESAASQARKRLDEVEEGGRELEEYSISNTEKDSVPLQYVEWEEIESPERYHRIMHADSLDAASYEEKSNIAFQAFRLTSERTDERLVCFQKFTRRQISMDSDAIRLAMGEERYDLFEQAVITIPEKIDCLWYDDTIYVFRSRRFEDIFDYLEQYKRHANTVLSGIDESELNIHNMDEFVESIESDRRALRKMESVRKRGLYEDMEQSEIEDVVDEFDLGVEVEKNADGEWGITIPDLRKKWDVIRLLNDDHVVSYVTDLQYQVYGKDLRD